MREKLKKSPLLSVLALLVCCMLLAAVYYLPLIRIGYWGLHETLDPSVLFILLIGLLMLLSGLSALLGGIFAKHFPHRSVLSVHLTILLLLAAAGYFVWPGQYVEAIWKIVNEIRPVDSAPVWRQLTAWVLVHPIALCSYGVSMGVYTLGSRKLLPRPVAGNT